MASKQSEWFQRRERPMFCGAVHYVFAPYVLLCQRAQTCLHNQATNHRGKRTFCSLQHRGCEVAHKRGNGAESRTSIMQATRGAPIPRAVHQPGMVNNPPPESRTTSALTGTLPCKTREAVMVHNPWGHARPHDAWSVGCCTPSRTRYRTGTTAHRGRSRCAYSHIPPCGAHTLRRVQLQCHQKDTGPSHAITRTSRPCSAPHTQPARHRRAHLCRLPPTPHGVVGTASARPPSLRIHW